MEDTKKLGFHDGAENEVPQTADEEKMVRRDIYICARLAVMSQSKAIEDIEAGRRESEPGTIGDIEWLRQSTARARQRIAVLAPEFVDDPTIEQEIVETGRFFADLAKDLGKKGCPDN